MIVRMGTDCSLAGITDESLMILLCDAQERNEVDALFSELHRRYQARVTTWCWRVVKDRELAADLTQEVFLRAYRYMHSYRGDSRLSTWLYSITRNYCLNALKSARRNPVFAAVPVPMNLSGFHGAEMQSTIERNEEFTILWRVASRALTPAEARVVALHYGHELPLAAITRQMKLVNPSGSKAYIVNARRKLNAALRSRRATTKTVPIAA